MWKISKSDIFLANIIASLFTFVALLPDYVYLKWKFDFDLWKRMMGYGLPILVGIAFAINEQFDKILLVKLPSYLHLKWGSIPATNLGLFMVLYGPHIL
jgi:hypothetical protein